MKKKKIAATCGRVIVLTIFLLIAIMPIYWMLITSLKTSKDVISLDIQYWPKNLTFDNYKAVLKGSGFLYYVKNSLITSLVSATIVLLAAIPGGYGLARYKFKGKGAVTNTYLITQMIPITLLLVPLMSIYGRLGLMDTLASVVILYVALDLSFAVITMQGFFKNIPVSMEEAALIDGCTKVQTITKIVLPVMRPGIIAVFIFSFISAWNNLLGGIMFISSDAKKTIPVGLSYYVGQYSIEWGEMMAGGMLALIPTAILFFIGQRYIVDGLTSGAEKG